MRVSLTARYVSHPTMEFGARQPAARSPRLGLPTSATVFHRPRAARTVAPTVRALRPVTSGFHFPSVGPAGGFRNRNATLAPGSPRVRRA
jgi:hypothetical protein